MEIGVDEAGKGPVLGSMFAAAVRAPHTTVPDGVDDSKRLSDDRREQLAETLRADDRLDAAVVEVPTTRIDAGNMNDLVVEAHAEAAGAVATAGDVGLCDAGDVDADRFAARVAARIEVELTVEARHGADADDDLVAAASVLAKSAREAHVDDLASAYGAVGSGYPSDRTTREFLRRHVDETGGLPDCARRSWATSEELLARAKQSALEEF
jgi:ribonuclease HII